MHILHCDETNLERKDNDFFVYGGIVLSATGAESLHTAIEELRLRFLLPAAYPLKFNPGPGHLDHARFAELKQSVIEAAVASGALLFTSMILHNIATSPDDARRNAINQLSYNFNAFLQQQGDTGFIFIDRFSDSQIDGHLRDKFATGVTGLPYSPTFRLNKVLGFHYAAIGQSHFGSVIDIVLGTLRFAVNAFTRDDTEKLARARQMLQMLAPIFQRTSFVGVHGPWTTELSLDFTPKTIKSDRYKAQYVALRRFLAESGIIAAQDIR